MIAVFIRIDISLFLLFTGLRASPNANQEQNSERPTAEASESTQTVPTPVTVVSDLTENGENVNQDDETHNGESNPTTISGQDLPQSPKDIQEQGSEESSTEAPSGTLTSGMATRVVLKAGVDRPEAWLLAEIDF